jgi:pyruvate ferredoxin oxidoreductase gamma subunit
MRLESIGGLGAHLAGQILAEAGVLRQGLSGAHFSSYGSEKKGSPVKSYVRLAPPEHKVRIASPVREPDLVAVFHEALLADPGVTAGLAPGGTLIVNTARSAEEIARQVKLPGVRVLALDAIEIAVQEQTRVNTAMLGAITATAPVLEPQAVRAAIADTFSRKYPQLVAANLRTFDRGFAGCSEYMLAATAAPKVPARTGLAVGYATAPIGGVLPTPGSSAHKDTSASRQGFLPVLSRELCVDCAVCDLVCPDFCLVWEPTGVSVSGYPVAKLLGVDYQYCKGCMACVEECPTGALTREREVGDIAQSLRVPVFVAASRRCQTDAAAEGR